MSMQLTYSLPLLKLCGVLHVWEWEGEIKREAVERHRRRAGTWRVAISETETERDAVECESYIEGKGERGGIDEKFLSAGGYYVAASSANLGLSKNMMDGLV